MGADARDERVRPPALDGRGRRIGIVCGRFNSRITLRLVDGARRTLARAGVADDDIHEVWVPGAFEIPFAAQRLATSGAVDAVICVGAVIRGETTHYDFVAGQCAEGIQRVQLETGVPVAFGVLTTEDVDQALARSEDESGHNVGADGAAVVLEMLMVADAYRPR